jgi:hypothetical protein
MVWQRSLRRLKSALVSAGLARKSGQVAHHRGAKALGAARRLASYPQAMQAVIQAAHALRRPLAEVTAEDVESWARTDRV